MTKLVTSPFPVFLFVALLVAFHTNCSAVAVASNAKPSRETVSVSDGEKKFLVDMGLDSYQHIEYRDEKNRSISYAAFDKLMETGLQFAMMKSKEAGKYSAVLSLKQKDKAPPVFTFKLKRGAKFPQFTLASVDGSTIDNSVLHDRYTLINFFFSECAPCVQEVPELNTFAQKHPDIGVMAVTFDELADAKSFASKTKFQWRIVVDAKSLLDKIGVVAYPSFALVDVQGMLVAIGVQSEIFAQPGGLEAWVKQFSSPLAIELKK